jgi:predicted ATPase/DNA-binding SARP family transcriptional activator
LRSRRGLWLLVLLALRAGRDVERRWLAGTLWPDSPDEVALGNLRRTLTDLRRALGPAEALITAPTPSALRLDLREGAASVDLSAFDAAVARGDHAAAVSRYAGPLVEGCDEDWVFADRERTAQQFLTAAEGLSAERIAAGDFAGAASAARRATGADPLRESAWRLLMEALARGGNRAGAGEAYRELRTLLRRELNADPDPATTALYRSLPEGAAAASSAPSPTAGPAAPPPTVRLPQYLTLFVGRERERAELAAALLSPDPGLTTLLGPGGVGKTRLAVETARVVADAPAFAGRFPGGVWFADLAAVPEAARLPAALTAVLELTDQRGGTADAPQDDGPDDATDRLVRALSARPPLLLILDNCEHLGDACTRLAAALLARGDRLRVLATSRHVLGTSGEAVFALAPLPLPELDDDPAADAPPTAAETLDGFAGTRLFLERARAAAPGFAPAGRQAEAVARICRRLDGLPLAIEMAAARVRALTPEEMERRLSDRFRVLTTGDRAALPRQQTLRALIDWSYGLLTEKERLLLRRLSVFAGGWTLDAAERVCGEEEPREGGGSIDAWEVLDLLTSLVDKSLAVFDAAGAEENGEGRYRLLESIREFVRSIDAGGQDDAVLRDRHLRYYAERADRGDESLVGDAPAADRAAWRAFFGREQPNLDAAWEWARQRGDWERFVLLAVGPWRHGRLGGRFVEVRRRLIESLALAGEFVSARTRARAHFAVGVTSLLQGDLDASAVHCAEAAALFQALEEPYFAGLALANVANAEAGRGNRVRAAEMLTEVEGYFRRTDRPSALAACLSNLGLILSGLGRHAEAQAKLEECLAIRRRQNDTYGMSITVNALALDALREGATDRAEDLAREAVELARQAENKAIEVPARNTLAEILCRAGGPAGEIRAHLATCLRLSRGVGTAQDVPYILENVARLRRREGDPAGAARLVAAADGIRRQLGWTAILDTLPGELSALRAALGDAAFEEVWSRGAALGMDAAVAEAEEYLAADLPTAVLTPS